MTSKAVSMIILLMATVPASAFHWPWEHHRPHHARHHRGGGVYAPRPLPDCKEVRAAVRDLKEKDPDALVKQLARSTKFQLDIIDRCMAQDAQ